jgi:hypothetical protein
MRDIEERRKIIRSKKRKMNNSSFNPSAPPSLPPPQSFKPLFPHDIPPLPSTTTQQSIIVGADRYRGK